MMILSAVSVFYPHMRGIVCGAMSAEGGSICTVAEDDVVVVTNISV